MFWDHKSRVHTVRITLNVKPRVILLFVHCNTSEQFQKLGKGLGLHESRVFCYILLQFTIVCGFFLMNFCGNMVTFANQLPGDSPIVVMLWFPAITPPMFHVEIMSKDDVPLFARYFPHWKSWFLSVFPTFSHHFHVFHRWNPHLLPLHPGCAACARPWAML